MSLQPDPFAVRMIFLRVAWMNRYQGFTGGDTMTGGGAYVAEHGFGHEMFNFRPFQGSVYGYGQPPRGGRRIEYHRASINIDRLDAAPGDEFVDRTLAVWVSLAPAGGTFVVGWYQNAMVYRDWQPPPEGSGRNHDGEECGYYVTARAEDAVLLNPDERVFAVPQGAGGIGQANIWYAGDPDQHRQFRLDLLRYVATRQAPADDAVPPRQPDPMRRQRVEEAAVRVTTDHFVGLGYRVDSVERDNVGWDLHATHGRLELRLEVKGLSGDRVTVDLTPNEYAAMREHRDTFRVCVVTNSLADPRLDVFAFSPDSGRWETPDGRPLVISEIVAARCTAS